MGIQNIWSKEYAQKKRTPNIYYVSCTGLSFLHLQLCFCPRGKECLCSFSRKLEI